jgi:hypothetical protein
MRSLRRTERIGQDPFEGRFDPPGFELERVVPIVSLAVVHEPLADPDDKPAAQGVDFGRLRAAARRPTSRLLLAVAATAVAILTIGDLRMGLEGALVVALGASIRYVDRHVAFSFGEGFVGYRGDPAWPQGVQEDDDVRWDWGRRDSENGPSGITATRISRSSSKARVSHR